MMKLICLTFILSPAAQAQKPVTEVEAQAALQNRASVYISPVEQARSKSLEAAMRTTFRTGKYKSAAKPVSPQDFPLSPQQVSDLESLALSSPAGLDRHRQAYLMDLFIRHFPSDVVYQINRLGEFRIQVGRLSKLEQYEVQKLLERRELGSNGFSFENGLRLVGYLLRSQRLNAESSVAQPCPQ